MAQKALEEGGIDKMLEEARENNKENDAENMRKTCKSIRHSDGLLVG